MNPYELNVYNLGNAVVAAMKLHRQVRISDDFGDIIGNVSQWIVITRDGRFLVLDHDTLSKFLDLPDDPPADQLPPGVPGAEGPFNPPT